jgi:hypothetical protein
MSTKFNGSLHSFPASAPLVIREATDSDRAALAAVAERDSAPAPAGEVLVAEAGGEIRAAIEVDGARAVADPFRPTAELVDLLRTRAAQIRRARHRRLRVIARSGTPVTHRRGIERAAA